MPSWWDPKPSSDEKQREYDEWADDAERRSAVAEEERRQRYPDQFR